MKITSINILELRVPLEKPVQMSFGTRTERRHIFVEILTDTEIKGIGETWTNFPCWAADERKITLAHIKPLLIGKDPLAINGIWHEIDDKILRADAGLQYGAKGPIYQALSGIDIALWDIRGKAYGVPVYKLLGGALRGSVQAYASGLAYNNYMDYLDKCLSEGFTLFKAKVGFGEQYDVGTVKAVRRAIGSHRLFADANQKWRNAQEAIDNLRALDEYRLGFIEEPVPANMPEVYQAIKDADITALAGGENLYGRQEFHTAMSKGYLDIIQPDVTKCGGITEAWAICEEARLYDKKIALHMFSTAVGLAASLQIMLAVQQAYAMEYDIADNVMMTGLPGKIFYRLQNGHFYIDEELPGIGIELNHDFLNKCLQR